MVVASGDDTPEATAYYPASNIYNICDVYLFELAI